MQFVELGVMRITLSYTFNFSSVTLKLVFFYAFMLFLRVLAMAAILNWVNIKNVITSMYSQILFSKS